jgi:hypothetical protein
MSELEFFLLTRVLTQNFNTVDIEGDIMQNHEQKQKSEKKVKNQDSMGKQTSFLAPCPSALGQFLPHGYM